MMPALGGTSDASFDTGSCAACGTGGAGSRVVSRGAGGLDPPQWPGARIQRTGASRQRRPAEIRAGVAIRDGRIVFVGTSEEARKYAGPATSVTDLQRADGHARASSTVTSTARGTPTATWATRAGRSPQVLAKLQACLDRPDQAAHKGTQRPALRAQLLRRGALAARDAAHARGPRPARHDPPGPSAQCRRPQVLAEQPRHREPRHRRAHARPARRPDRPRRRGPPERLLRRHGMVVEAVARSHRCRRRRRSSSCGSRTPMPTAWGSRRCSSPARSRTGCRAGRRCSRKAGSRCAPTSRCRADFVHETQDASRACEADRRAR